MVFKLKVLGLLFPSLRRFVLLQQRRRDRLEGLSPVQGFCLAEPSWVQAKITLTWEKPLQKIGEMPLLQLHDQAHGSRDGNWPQWPHATAVGAPAAFGVESSGKKAMEHAEGTSWGCTWSPALFPLLPRDQG